MRDRRPAEYRPNRSDFTLGPMFYANDVGVRMRAIEDAMDRLSPDFPDDCCAGESVPGSTDLLAPEGMLVFGGAKISGEVIGGRGTNTWFDVLRVPFPRGSVAEELDAALRNLRWSAAE